MLAIRRRSILDASSVCGRLSIVNVTSIDNFMPRDIIKLSKLSSENRGGSKKSSADKIYLKAAAFILATCVLFFAWQVVQATTLPDYLRGGGDAERTLGNFINGALNFITALLWGIWAIFSAIFAKDLIMGAEAETIRNKIIKLGAAALVLLSITALPALFAGFAS